MRTRRHPNLMAAVLLAVGILLLVPACGDTSQPTLRDTAYWRTKLSKGEGVDFVVAKGSDAVPLLEDLLKDSNEYVVQGAAMAAQQIGEPAAATVPALLAALARFPGQPYVMQALKKMKGSAVEYLVPLLESRDPSEQTRAVDALNGIGHEAASAVEPLMVIIEDSSAPVDLKRKALVTLGSIGTPASSALKRLRVIYDQDGTLKNEVATAMKRIATEKKVIKKGGDQ